MTHEQFKFIFEKHFDEVRNYIYYRSGNSDLATDIAQETFIKVWEKKFLFESNHTRGLLFKIAGDLFISSYRKNKVKMNFQFNYRLNETNTSPEEILNFTELSKQFDEALTAMPEIQRTVFLMSRRDQLKYIEIAENLRISTKAVEKRMSKALSFLKLRLNP